MIYCMFQYMLRLDLDVSTYLALNASWRSLGHTQASLEVLFWILEGLPAPPPDDPPEDVAAAEDWLIPQPVPVLDVSLVLLPK